jgi:hypothetical protein
MPLDHFHLLETEDEDLMALAPMPTLSLEKEEMVRAVSGIEVRIFGAG